MARLVLNFDTLTGGILDGVLPQSHQGPNAKLYKDSQVLDRRTADCGLLL